MRSVLRLGAAFVAALCVMCVSVFAGEGCSECEKRSNEDIIVLQRNMIARDNTSFKAEDVYNAAKEYIDSLAEDGSWKDIDYLTTPSVTFPAHAHIERLRMIARAYTIPNQPLFESEEAREAIERALPVVESKVLKMTNGVRQTPGNWWWWNLSIPPKLGFILVSVEGKIDTEVYNTSLESIKWCLQHPMDWYLKGLTGQATNSVDAIKGNLYYSALTNNSANIEFIMSEFEKNLKVARVPFEGIAFDNAFIAHNMIDFYGYYSTTVLDTVNVLEYVKNTKYAPGDDVLDTFSACLLDGAFWTVYQNYRELGASGRSMYGPFTTNSTSSVMTGLRYLASFDNTYRDKAQSMLDKIESGYEANTGYKFFSSADFGVKKSDNSYVSVRMSSSRIKAAEAWGGNGQTNLFMGDGCMWIYNDAKKVYDTNMLACLDWTRLAGTTVIKNAVPLKYWSSYFAAEPFVGGVSTGKNGVQLMNLSHISLPLSAQKSWFFFDDEVVCMGSRITAQSDDETHTVVDQREQTSGNTVVNGKALPSGIYSGVLEDTAWIADEGIGYYFPNKTDVNFERNTRTGSWKLLAGSQSDRELSAEISSIYINHGKQAKDKKYCYAALPNADAAKVKEYANGSTFEVIENSDSVHAVRDLSSNSTGMVFWPKNRGMLSAVTANDSAYYDGIRPRAISERNTRTSTVTVKGRKGTVSADSLYGAQTFAVSENRISGDVYLTVNWFDDRNAKNGSYWKVGYLTPNGARYTESVPYRYTDKWTTTVLKLENTQFSGTVTG